MTESVSFFNQFPIRNWYRSDCAVFCKTKEQHGGCSNMAGGYPIIINGVSVRSSEALYQAMRFPHLPEVQQLVIEQNSPFYAKKVAQEFIDETRPDWEEIKVLVMAWAVRLKLVHNPLTFGGVLDHTGSGDIVELSMKDDFWGATPAGGVLVGRNILGILLSSLRDENRISAVSHATVPVPDMKLLGEDI